MVHILSLLYPYYTENKRKIAQSYVSRADLEGFLARAAQRGERPNFDFSSRNASAPLHSQHVGIACYQPITGPRLAQNRERVPLAVFRRLAFERSRRHREKIPAVGQVSGYADLLDFAGSVDPHMLHRGAKRVGECFSPAQRRLAGRQEHDILSHQAEQ